MPTIKEVAKRVFGKKNDQYERMDEPMETPVTPDRNLGSSHGTIVEIFDERNKSRIHTMNYDFRYRCEAEKIFYHREDVYITVVECLAASEGYQVILSVRGHDGANKVLQKTEPRENVEKALDLAQLMVRGQAQVLVEKKLESRGQGQSTGKPIEMVVEEVHKIWMRKIEHTFIESCAQGGTYYKESDVGIVILYFLEPVEAYQAILLAKDFNGKPEQIFETGSHEDIDRALESLETLSWDYACASLGRVQHATQ